MIAMSRRQPLHSWVEAVSSLGVCTDTLHIYTLYVYTYIITNTYVIRI